KEKRKALARAYAEEDSRLRRWLQGIFLPMLATWLVGSFIAGIAIAKLATEWPGTWIGLLVAVFVWAIEYERSLPSLGVRKSLWAALVQEGVLPKYAIFAGAFVAALINGWQEINLPNAVSAIDAFTQVFKQTSKDYGDPSVGAIAGAFQALQMAIAWEIMSRHLDVLAWFVFFLIAAVEYTPVIVTIAGINRLFLWVMGEGVPGVPWVKVGLSVFLVLVMIGLEVSLLKSFITSGKFSFPLSISVKCDTSKPLNLSPEQKRELSANVAPIVERTKQRLTEVVDRNLDITFQSLEDRVDRYLDWEYSVLADYEKIYHTVKGDLEDYVSAQFSSYVLSSAPDPTDTIKGVAGLILEKETKDIADAIKNSDLNKCQLEKLNLRVRIPPPSAIKDLTETAVSAGVGISVAIILKKTIAKKVGVGLAKVAAKIAAKAATKTGGGASGALIGALIGTFLGGPVGTVIGGIIGGIISWIITDEAVNAVDEYFSRDERKMEIISILRSEKAKIRERLVGQLHYAAEQVANQILSATTGGEFVPYRDAPRY
ncbi:MAG: hypothetical protein D6771_08295, partial [Zetaproteobacteria bacterium]